MKRGPDLDLRPSSLSRPSPRPSAERVLNTDCNCGDSIRSPSTTAVASVVSPTMPCGPAYRLRSMSLSGSSSTTQCTVSRLRGGGIEVVGPDLDDRPSRITNVSTTALCDCLPSPRI